MITVSNAEQALLDAGFDVVCLESPALNVPSRYRVEHLRAHRVYFWNEQELIAFAEAYALGFPDGYVQGQKDMLAAEIADREGQC